MVGDECRLLIVIGLPRAINLQERFMLTKMASSLILHDRIRTRIIQAVGRCTRGATDYSTVVVIDDDFQDWMVLKDKQKLFHPELQGEFKFGIEQSNSTEIQDYVDNLNVFLEHKDDWDDVDADILSYRDESTKENLEEESNLFAAVRNEVKYVYAIWDEDYEKATEFAQEVVTAYTGGVRLKGLRALWNYFAGSSALLVAEKFNKSNYKAISETHFIKAAAAAKTVGWLRSLANTQNATIEDTENLVDELLDSNIERLDLLFSQKNYTNQHTFEIEIADILKRLGINKAKTFEGAVSDIGKLLGFISENPSGDAEPDPYWQVDDKLCLIFEAKSDAKVSTPVSVRYATQIASQSVTWVKENLELSENATIIPVLVTPQIKIEESAVIHAKECRYWEINLFREWVVQDVIPIIRKLRSKYPGPSDMMWRAETADIISAANLSPSSIVDSLRKFLKDLPS